MLPAAGNLNVSVTNTGRGLEHSLFAAAGDPADPTNVSGQADTDLAGPLPEFEVALTGTSSTTAWSGAERPNPTQPCWTARLRPGHDQLLQAIWVTGSRRARRYLGDLFGIA